MKRNEDKTQEEAESVERECCTQHGSLGILGLLGQPHLWAPATGDKTSLLAESSFCGFYYF